MWCGVQSSKPFQVVSGLVLNPKSIVDGLRLVVDSNGTFSGATSASVDGYSASVSIEASPSTLDLSLNTSNSFSVLGLLKSSLKSLGLSVTVPASGPSASAQLEVRNKSVASLSVAFLGTVSVEQISRSLGFSWPFSSDVLAVTDPSVEYAAKSGAKAMRLAISAQVAIPVLSFDGGGALLIQGKDSVTFAVSVQELLGAVCRDSWVLVGSAWNVVMHD